MTEDTSVDPQDVDPQEKDKSAVEKGGVDGEEETIPASLSANSAAWLVNARGSP